MTSDARHGGGWLSGLIATLVVGLLAGFGALQSVDRAVYDRAQRHLPGAPSNDVVLIEADPRSLDALGPWPWPRARHADLLARLGPAEPSVVALAFDLPPPEPNPARILVGELREQLRGGALADVDQGLARLDQRLAAAAAQNAEAGQEPIALSDLSGLRARLASAREDLDRRLAQAGVELDSDRAMLAGLQGLPEVVLPFRFAAQGSDKGSTPQRLPDLFERSILGMVRDPYRPLAGTRLVLPAEDLNATGDALGYLQVQPDSDGVVRSSPLLVQRQARLLPSFALATLARHRQQDLGGLRLEADGVLLGGLRLPAGRELRQRIVFSAGQAISRVSAVDVLGGQTSVAPLRAKIVVIGPTAAGAVPRYSTPRGELLSPAEIAVHAISNLLQGRALRRPDWTSWLEWGVFGLVALGVIFGLPRLSGGVALLLGLLSAVALLGAEYGLLVSASLWLPLGSGAVLLLAGVLSLLLGRGLVAGRAATGARSEDSARVEPAPKQPAPPVAAPRPDNFGPYQVEELLGRTGSGARYLCRDTRLDRRVVVQDFELGLGEREQATVKQRFLAEVEQAELLDHPAILPVEQGGDAQRRLFVVNPYLEGWDLRRVAQPNRLLKVPQALEIAAKCAEALALAHSRNLLHGEVCPQNILYTVANKQIKLAGFGTSVVTASLHARGDRLLPTSFYLSPEYLTGDRVDGRADLFALGVTLYQLLSGQLPFRADTLATLSYRIVNEPHPPIQPLRPEVPDCAVLILDRCLAKTPADRYQDGLGLARELRVCGHRALRGQA